MTVRNPKRFDPETLLSAPRRSAGVPNADGTKILYTSSTHNFDKHEKTANIFVLDIASSESTLIEDNKKCSNPVWLDGHDIALLRSNDDDSTEVLIGSVDNFKADAYVAGKLDGPADNLKIRKLADHHYVLAVSAPANPDGTIYNPSKAKKPHSTGRLYRSLFVRHWDTWIAPQRNAIWYATLSKAKSSQEPALSEKHIHYTLSSFVNALKGTALESPIPPFGGTDEFDVSKTGIIFVAKDPDLDPAVNTKVNLYLIPLADFTETAPTIYQVLIPEEFQGALTSPAYSPDGAKAAVLAMKENGYEADKNEILILPKTTDPTNVDHIQNGWDRSPSAIAWSPNSAILLLLAEDRGSVSLFATAVEHDDRPSALALDGFHGSISDMKVLPSNTSSSPVRVFVSGSSLVDSSRYGILELDYRFNPNGSRLALTENLSFVSSWSQNGLNLGLASSQVSQMYSPCAAHQEGVPGQPTHVHSWIVRPKNFDKSKKYPLAFFIHGGPQGAWTNAWSTRWNPAVFAEQGYIVVAPNPTGSTGYGKNFTDAIAGEWGNWPYKDLVNCVKYIEDNLDYVDMDKAVALGGSFGGYMVNWIQGHELGRKFKALVTHDGIFSTAYQVSTEELYFVNHDLGGPWSESRKEWRKWSPARFTENWKTPQLIIHSEKDYRLTMADALAAFNILQSQGVESELLTFPDENHWVLNPENSLMWHTTVFNFINRHVGLPPYHEHEQSEIIQDPPRPPKSEARVIKCTKA